MQKRCCLFSLKKTHGIGSSLLCMCVCVYYVCVCVLDIKYLKYFYTLHGSCVNYYLYFVILLGLGGGRVFNVNKGNVGYT